jgi:hypothetical protein
LREPFPFLRLIVGVLNLERGGCIGGQRIIVLRQGPKAEAAQG